MAEHGADLTINSDETDFKALRGAVRELAKERGIPSWRQKIFECSGTAAGQGTAFGLIGHGSEMAAASQAPQMNANCAAGCAGWGRAFPAN